MSAHTTRLPVSWRTHTLVMLSLVLLLNASMRRTNAQGPPQSKKPPKRPPQSKKPPKRPRSPKKPVDPLIGNKIGRCKCPTGKQSLEERFRTAFSVVLVRVLNWTISEEFTRDGAIPQFQVRNYILYVTRLYKGPYPRPNSVFEAQGFVHGDSCGLKLQTRRPYLLNLDDPGEVSPGNIWQPGVFVVNRCQNHFDWRGLRAPQLVFLFNNKDETVENNLM